VVDGAPPALIELLRRSERFSELTDGAFDITVAPLLDLYRERTATGGTLPTDDEIADALELVDYRRVDVRGTTVTLTLPLMAITLDAIAKGYAADRALATLAGLGIGRALVQAGGDIAAMVAADAPEDEAWEVAIQDPRRAGGSLGTLRLIPEATPDAGFRTEVRGVATSGDYVNAFTSDRSVHHILDPRTGRSPTELSSATVVAPSATDADALATSAMVMGREAGLAFLEELSGVEGLLVTRNGQILRTAGFPAV
jgi:thiamine biosynthesis lipoprotein